MTSARRLAANRRNARMSTGPRTAAGKARVARNAYRHGLSLPVSDDPAWSGEIAVLARRIAGEVPVADRIAVAQIALERVRRERTRLLAEKPGATSAIRRLATLDHYERYALSARRRAIWEDRP